MQNNIRQIMQHHTLVPVVTINGDHDPIAVMQFLINQGVRCIEVTLRNDHGMNAIEAIKKHFGDQVLAGAGTVVSKIQVEQLVHRDADFMVSPGLTPDLASAMQHSGIPYLPGVSTPSEIIQAMELGLDTLKFFPANLFGGINALKTYGQVFPSVKFCPTGGVTEQTSAEYLALPNVFAVGGSWFMNGFN